MRVLIILSAVIGAAFAGAILPVPLVYAGAHLEPRKAFEYSSSVQTADYANYASVKSDNAGLATIATVPALPTVGLKSAALIAPAAPATVYHQYTPQVYAAAAAPLLAVHPAAPIHTLIAAPQAYAATHQYVVPAAPALLHHARSAPTVVATAAVEAAPLLKTLAEPAPIVETIVEHVATLAAPGVRLLAEKSQYHAQDELGQAAYGHAEALQTHNAVQDAAGNKAGSYSYVAPDGRVLTTDYVADENGYRVATNALPVDVHHARRRRSTLALTTVPLVKEHTRTDIAGHSSTVRLDTVSANVLTHAVPLAAPLVYTSTAYAAASLPQHVAYAYPTAGLSTYTTLY